MTIFCLFLFCLAVSAFPVLNYVLIKKSAVNSETIYKSKFSGAEFKEVKRYETESVMLRLDINTRILVPHKELEKNFIKV